MLVVGLGLALAGLYVYRAAAIEALIANALTARGVSVGGLSVTRVGLEELRIADLSLGTNGELRVRALRVSYQELLSKVGDGGFQAARSISFSPSLNLTPSPLCQHH